MNESKHWATIPFPRPCVVRSHNLHVEGLCHTILVGDGIALVETAKGDILRYDLRPGSAYSLTFTDRNE